MKWIYLFTYLLFGIPEILCQSNNIELIATDDKNIIKAAGSYRGEQFAYVTENGLYTLFDNTKKLFTKAEYVLNNQTYSTSFVNNIKDLSCNVDGRIYVTTFDDHIIMFEKGKILIGLPLKANDLHQSFNGLVCTNLFLNNNWYVAELLVNPIRFDDIFESSNYLSIQTDLNMLMPDQLSINEQYFTVVTGANKRDIAYPSTGNKLKWQKVSDAFIPCNEITDISSSRIFFTGVSGIFYQIFTVCSSGDVWVWTRKLNTNADLNLPFLNTEWEKLDILNQGGYKVKELTHTDLNFIVGFTDRGQKGLFVYNIPKKAFCPIELPSAERISDYFYSPFESLAVVAAGKDVYAVGIDASKCIQNTSHTDENITSIRPHYYPNPTSGNITIDLPDYVGSELQCIITDISGRLVLDQDLNVIQGKAQCEFNLPTGSYSIFLMDNNRYFKTLKLIVQ